jgi:hypothetical protein
LSSVVEALVLSDIHATHTWSVPGLGLRPSGFDPTRRVQGSKVQRLQPMGTNYTIQPEIKYRSRKKMNFLILRDSQKDKGEEFNIRRKTDLFQWLSLVWLIEYRDRWIS